MGLHDEAKLDAKFGAFAKQMNLYLNHFPKHEKYALAQEIRRKAYEVYGYIVEAQNFHPGPRAPHRKLATPHHPPEGATPCPL